MGGDTVGGGEGVRSSLEQYLNSVSVLNRVKDNVPSIGYKKIRIRCQRAESLMCVCTRSARCAYVTALTWFLVMAFGDILLLQFSQQEGGRVY